MFELKTKKHIAICSMFESGIKNITIWGIFELGTNKPLQVVVFLSRGQQKPLQFVAFLNQGQHKHCNLQYFQIRDSQLLKMH